MKDKKRRCRVCSKVYPRTAKDRRSWKFSQIGFDKIWVCSTSCAKAFDKVVVYGCA